MSFPTDHRRLLTAAFRTLFPIFLVSAFILTCTDDFSSSLNPGSLSGEDSLWLADNDGDGWADSIQLYTPDCDLPVEECLVLARDEKRQIVDSLTLATPLVSAPTGTYNQVIYVELSTDENAIIRYTLDGTDPDSRSAPYTTPIKVDTSLILKARAFNPGLITSHVLEVEYIINVSEQLEPPGFDVPAGTYDSMFAVTLTAAEGADIFYTLDGSNPTTVSTEYQYPVPVSRSLMIKAIAVKEGFLQSDPDSAAYVLQPAVPVASLNGGEYTEALSVTLTSTTAGAVIRYTLDNSDPSEASAEYADTISIPATATLKARAFFTGWTASVLMEEAYVISITGTAGGAVFDPPGGTYSSVQQVTITSSTDSADIRYTLDGSEPDSSSDSYSGPVNVVKNTLIRSRVYRSGMEPSAAAAASYRFQPPPPEISPATGIYETAVTMTIGHRDSAEVSIRYTVNGQDPDSSSLLYDDPVSISTSQSIRARAFRPGWDPSGTDTAIYTIRIPGQVEAPLFQPGGGVYRDSVTVTITSATSGAFIYYTTEGDEPTESSILYTVPVKLTGSKTIRAMAVKTGMQNSGVSSAEYEIKKTSAAELPVFNPPGGTFTDSLQVTITTATAGALIYYTDDGDTPTANATLYKGPFFLKETTILKAAAVKTGLDNSPVASANFTKETVKAEVIFSAPGGEVEKGTKLRLTTAAVGGKIYYTLDGSTPATSSTLFMEDITIDTSMTVRAGVWIAGTLAGEIAEETYTVLEPPVITYIGPEGKFLAQGNTERISWTATGNVGRIAIEYRYGGSGWNIIVFGYTGDTYDWLVPAIETDDLIIRVRNTVGTAEDSSKAPLVVAPGAKFSVPGGRVTVGTYFTMTSDAVGGTIHYTLDGSTPTPASDTVRGYMVIDTVLTVRAGVWIDGEQASGISEVTYLAALKPPWISPPGGVKARPFEVSIAVGDAGAQIYYTLDGTDPDNSSLPYSENFTITHSLTVKAIAVKPGLYDSDISSETYTVNSSQVCVPNQPSCNDNTAVTCNSAGDGYLSGGKECGSQVCVSGSCVNATVIYVYREDISEVTSYLECVPYAVVEEDITVECPCGGDGRCAEPNFYWYFSAPLLEDRCGYLDNKSPVDKIACLE